MGKEGKLFPTLWLCLVKGREIKKGHLLALLCGEPTDVRLDKVFLFVNELRCPFRHQFPGKYRFLCARQIGTFPHKKPVLLGLIPQALPVCEELGGFILVGGFQIAGPFLRIGMDGEEKLDLLFLVLEVVILVGDDGHDLLFI